MKIGIRYTEIRNKEKDWTVYRLPHSISPRLLLLALGLCLLLPVKGQRFGLKTYTVSEGLAQSQVFSLLEDHRGFIWTGTRGGGLSRFDGQDFQVINTRDGLINNYILSLYEHRDQGLWIGTDNGCSRYDGDDFQNYTLDPDRPVSVRAFCELDDTTLLMGTQRGIYRMASSDSLPYLWEIGQLGAIYTFMKEGERLWIGHSSGLSYWESDTLIHLGRRQGLPRLTVTDLLRAPDGRLWVATYGRGLYYQQGARFKTAFNELLPGRGLLFDLLAPDSSQLWIATQDAGAIRINLTDSSLLVLDDQQGLPTNHIAALLQDKWGHIWMGTSGGGISKYFGQTFVHYEADNALPARAVYAILEDADCKKWIGAGAKGVAYEKEGKWVLASDSSNFPRVKAKSLFQDREGRIWVGTEGQGVWVKADSNWKNFDGTTGLSGNWIRDILQDEAGYVWVATAGGGISRMKMGQDSSRYEAEFIQIWGTRQGLSQARINCLYRDRSDRIWYGTQSRGVGYLDARRKPHNISLPGGASTNAIRAMIGDAFGYIWIATAGGGLIRLDSRTQQVQTYTDRLTSTNLYLLAFDAEGHLWIGSESGLDRATLDPDRSLIDIRHFGYAEGFLGVEVCRDAVMEDFQSNLWFGTVNGLTQYNPVNQTRSTEPPQLSFEEISLFYSPINRSPYEEYAAPWHGLKPGLQLPHKQNNLSFDFIGINLSNPEAVRYQWQLIGWEEGWSPVSFKSDATYSNLPPGPYTFRVRAANEDMIWSQPLSVSFEILIPYWQKWWFIAAVSGGILLLITLIFSLRIQTIRRKAQEEQERLEMKNHLLEVEQKALRLQMNPHFIFNALNSIQSLIGSEDTKTARFYLSKFSRLMRMVLESSRQSRITLEEEMKMLADYLSLEQFSRDNRFDFIIEAKDLEADEVDIPPLLIQPFVENAIIHGITPLDRKGEIKVDFYQQDEFLWCRVRDNGIGREAAARRKQLQPPTGRNSTALKVIGERLALLPEQEAHAPGFEILDLTAPDGSVIGTEVVVRMPYEGL